MWKTKKVISYLLLLVALWTVPSFAGYRELCMLARNLVGIPVIEDRFEIPEVVSVTAKRTGRGHRSITLAAKGLETLEGEEIPAPLYSVGSSDVIRSFGIETGEGDQFTVYILTPGTALLFPVDIKNFVPKFPAFFARAGIRATSQVLILGSSSTMNQHIEEANLSTGPKDFRIGARFAPNRTLFDIAQGYSYEKFFDTLLDGKILLAVAGYFGRHDQLAEHLSGGLFVSDTFMSNIVNTARLLDAVSKDPILKKQISKTDLEYARNAFSSYWDSLTEELARTLLSDRDWSQKRRELRPLLERHAPDLKNGIYIYDSAYEWGKIKRVIDKLENLSDAAKQRWLELKEKFPTPTLDADAEMDKLQQALAI